MKEFHARLESIGARIKSERLNLGLTQKVLSGRLQISIPQLSEWENGRRFPTPRSLARIATAMDIPIRDLLGDISDLRGIEFGERLKTLRHAKGMTLQDLSSLMDLSHVTISLWETGASEPKASDIGRLAIALAVSCDFLIFGKD